MSKRTTTLPRVTRRKLLGGTAGAAGIAGVSALTGISTAVGVLPKVVVATVTAPSEPA